MDVFASSQNGFVKKTVTTNSTAVTVSGTEYGGSVAYSLPALNNTTYQVGVGPSIPASFHQPGSPPPPQPTFTFMPAPPTEVQIVTDNLTQNFTLVAAGKTIAGTVKDSAGTGINGAQVFARPSQSSTTGTSSGAGVGAQTDTQGAFTLNVPPGVYLVGVFKPGMPPTQDQQITVPSSGANTPATLAFVLDASTSSLTISGTVTDDSGNAIPYAGVGGRKVVSTSDTTPVGGDSGNFVGGPTDANGAYTLYISAGTWVLESFAPGFGRLGTKTVTVSTTSLTGQDFSAQTLATGTIKGQATKATVAQQGVMVRAEGSNGGNMAVTDASGNYALKVPAGTYAITCYFPGVGESAPVTGVTVTASTDTTGKDCSLTAPITITVNLTDGTNPITGGFVDVRASNGRGNSMGTYTTSGANAVYTVLVPAGTYVVRAGHPSYGMIGTTASAAYSANTTITYTASVGATFAVTGTVTGDGTALANSWVSINGTPTGQTNIINLGGLTNSSGAFSISVPNGIYRVRADKPGYKSPVGGAVTVNGVTVSAGTIALTTASLTITGTVVLNSAGVSNAFVDATDGNGGFAVAQTDSTGAYSLPVSNGTWTVRAGSIGYESSAITVTISGSNSANNTLTLTAISGFTIRPEKQETITPTSGGFFTNTDIGANFKMNIPANALGTSSNASTIKTQTNTSLPNPPTGTILSKNAVSISATDSSGAPIKTLNDSVTITIPYTEADLPTGTAESSLVIGVWNATTNNYDTLSTTVDITADTLTAIVDHFSDFAPLVASGGAPAIPSGFQVTSNGGDYIALSWTAVTGATSYDIYRSATSGGTFTRVGNEPTVSGESTNTYINVGLDSSTTYYYKITSLNLSGESASSSAISGATTSRSSGSGVSISSPVIVPASTPPPTPVVIPPSSTTPTAAELQAKIDALRKAIEGTTVGQSGQVPKGILTKALNIGAKGNEVTVLQNFLKAQGVDIYPEGSVTGYFGPATKRAIQKFQEKHGIAKPGEVGYGILGPKTRAKVNELSGTVTTTTTTTTPAGETTTVTTTTTFKLDLALGSQNASVTALQNFLKAQGVDIYPEGSVTGYFGPATTRAIQRFQVKYGIANEGEAGYGNFGPKTRAKANQLSGQ